jgi:hypothetical protein
MRIDPTAFHLNLVRQQKNRQPERQHQYKTSRFPPPTQNPRQPQIKPPEYHRPPACPSPRRGASHALFFPHAPFLSQAGKTSPFQTSPPALPTREGAFWFASLHSQFEFARIDLAQ